MKKIIVSLTLLAVFCLASCSGEASGLEDKRDGKKYKTVKIGEQVWMAENLNYDAKGSVCYDKDTANCDKYGRLYSWKTAMEACPDGWHLPSKEEWQEFIDFAGGADVAGKKLRAKNFNSGSDNYGFSALPSGALAPDFNGIGLFGFWWSASKTKSNSAYLWNINSTDRIAMQELDISIGSSIRCLQNKSNATEDISAKAEKETVSNNSFKDPRDDKTYKTVKIGTQTWMAENLNYNEKGSKCAGTKQHEKYEEDGEEHEITYYNLTNDNTVNCDKYGRLYNWATAKKACPSGWHLPSDTEWQTLVNFAGEDAAKKFKAKNGWDNNYEGKSGGGTDDFNFSALPGGYTSGELNKLSNIGNNGIWWSSTGSNASSAWFRGMTNNRADVDRGGSDKKNLFSVRCLQD